ncbi:transposase [Paraburkholderia sp. LEh10]|nr:transposase [Paraburkholderia sp. LEh10]
MSVLGNGGVGMVLPILSRPVPETGNTNKVKIALALVRAVSGVTQRPIRVLFDSWFMRARLVLPLLRQNMHVIGQARIDTALFLPPVRSGGPRRGRPRIYGKRLCAEAIEALPATELMMRLYGKEQRVRLRPSRRRSLPQGHDGARRLVPVLQRQAAGMDKATPDPGFRSRPGATDYRSALRAPLGHRTAVSQSQALVGIQQSLAADAHRTRTLDADSFVRLDTHAVAQPGDCRRLPDAQNCAVENRSARHRRPGRSMAASRIYRTCLPHSRAWEVPKIPEARSASRPLSSQSSPLARPRMLVSSQSQSRSPSDRQRSATAFGCLKFSVKRNVAKSVMTSVSLVG